MRILYLIDAASPQASPSTLALLAQAADDRDPADEHTVLLLGGNALLDAAQRAGIANALYLNVPFASACAGWAGVRKAIHKHGPFDLLHCFSPGTLTWAAAFCRDTPRLLTVTMPPAKRTAHWLRIVASTAPGPTAFVPISNTIRRELLAGGIDKSQAHVVRPGIARHMIGYNQRAAIRHGWQIDSPKAQVVALLCDPPTAADARRAALVIGLISDAAATGDIPVRLLIHPGQYGRRQTGELLANFNHPDRLILDADLACPWQVLPGCDIALAIGPAAGGLSLLWAMAANIPIVGEATYAISEILEDRHSALLAMPDRAPALANRITRLLHDSRLAWQLRDTSNSESFSFFSPQRYRRDLHTVYEQLAAGRPIEVPAMEVTGGLRFAGRA